MSKQENKQPPLYRGFVQGGLAAMSGSAASHPLDVIKVRLQIQGEGGGGVKLGPLAMGRSIAQQDGMKGLFKGLSASLLRQAVYSSVRFGVYDKLKAMLGERPDNPIDLASKIGAGLVAGGIGAVVGNPADVTMVRMQADGKLPPELRRNYRNVFHGLSSIVKEEGVLALWRGSSTTVVRAMVVTASQFAAYEKIKESLIATGVFADNPATHMTSGFLAGFVASCTSNPVDVIKTRLMNSSPGEYTGPVDCLSQTVAKEGPMALYKGFVPTFVRQAPYVIVTFLTLEQIKGVFRMMDEV